MSTPASKAKNFGSPEKTAGNVIQRFSIPLHSVWGRVVPDIPAFCRELVAALAEQ
jgi:hypothetical protein